MRKKRPLAFHIFVFIIVEIAWVTILTLWIIRYISRQSMISKTGEDFPLSTELLVFIGGILLLVGISLGLFLFFRNMTIQYRLNSLYDLFIANITHELKSPLASIQLYLETFEQRSVPEDKQKIFFGHMKKDVGRLNRLISMILRISGLEERRGISDFHIYDADQLLQLIVKEVSEDYSLPENLITINGEANNKCVVDIDAFSVAFANLVDNAIKYSIDKPRIEISVKTTKKKIEIEFSDNGVGIPIKEQKKVFQKFYRGKSQNSPSVKGTGLGLYWVKEILDYHGGNISIKNGTESGTTFFIELPIYKREKSRRLNRLLRIAKENRNRKK